MLRVVSCLAYDHDYWFVLVAAVVCVAGSVMTIRLFDRARRLTGSSSMAWVLLSGVAGGTAIWTTHFVAMLGFHPPAGFTYAPGLTLASLALAMIFTAAGLYIIARGFGTALVEAGGAVTGLGISIMHYTGMAGLDVAGRIEWDIGVAAASIVFGIGFATLAANRIGRNSTLKGQMLAAGLLVLAICSMHFTAMGAATFIPEPSIHVVQFSSEMMAISVVAILSLVTGLGLYVIDARSRREILDGFRHAALHDALTGMPNRAQLSSRLPAMLEASRRAGDRVAVIVMDLDRFKDVNDVHGHTAGDFLLQSLTVRLRDVIQDGEFIARVGGDEFIAVKYGISRADEALDFARRLVDCVCVPVMQDDRALSVGASLGISLYPTDATGEDELVAVADLAMYRAKKQIGQKICFYDQSMDEGRRARSALAMELRGAIERGEFVLHYQPQVDVGSGTTTGLEALLRWRHPRRGIVPPGEFIPIAEETGFILPLGEWVLRSACAEAARWRNPLKISVNIAAAQLTQSDLPRIVHEALLETGLAPGRLELEITEASIIDDLQHTLHVVRKLKALGVTIAMDDYGTGYSSLSTLQVFPFDKIKIDRSFIEGVTVDKASAAIVKATILLAGNLDIPVLAEGVELQEHFDFLRAEGCTEVQGYLFGRPQPLSELVELIGVPLLVPDAARHPAEGRAARIVPAAPVSSAEILPVGAVAQAKAI